MRTQSADTDLQAEKIQLDLLRRATLERRVATRAIRRRNPDLDDHQVLLRFVEIHHGSELAEGLWRDLARRSK